MMSKRKIPNILIKEQKKKIWKMFNIYFITQKKGDHKINA